VCEEFPVNLANLHLAVAKISRVYGTGYQQFVGYKNIRNFMSYKGRSIGCPVSFEMFRLSVTMLSKIYCTL